MIAKIAEIVLCCLLLAGQLFASQKDVRQSEKTISIFQSTILALLAILAISQIRLIRVHPW